MDTTTTTTNDNEDMVNRKAESVQPAPSPINEEEEDVVIEEPAKPVVSIEEDWHTKYLYLYADYQNYRKRVGKDMFNAQNSTREAVILSFLSILDDIDRGLNNNPDDVALNLIKSNALNVLKTYNVRPYESLKQKFDVKLHDALMTVDAENMGYTESDIVCVENRKGYFIKPVGETEEKVLRPAQVAVTKLKED